MGTSHPLKQPSLGPIFDFRTRHRLFFAIRPDIAAIASVARLMHQMRRDEIVPGRPVDPGRLHVTLHHLGDFDHQIPPGLLSAAGEAAATIVAQPFDIGFDRIGGTRGQVLLRTSDGSPAVRAFRQCLSAALTKAGLRRYMDWAFNPHITLSYDFCDVPEQQVNPVCWTVHHFFLIESLFGQHQHITRGHWTIGH